MFKKKKKNSSCIIMIQIHRLNWVGVLHRFLDTDCIDHNHESWFNLITHDWLWSIVLIIFWPATVIRQQWNSGLSCGAAALLLTCQPICSCLYFLHFLHPVPPLWSHSCQSLPSTRTTDSSLPNYFKRMFLLIVCLSSYISTTAD